MAALQPGAEFAGYRVEALIGRGGMGYVYRAQDERLKRKVALKVLPPAGAADHAFRTRFIRESEAAASIDHPNMIPIFEAGEESGALFIAMRYVDGLDLKQYLAQRGPLEPEEAADLLEGASGALDAAHEQGLIHRDVKPQNVLISLGPGSTGGRHVYLTDFGLMKEKEVGREVTAEGQFVGTIDYVAPEQIEGQPLDGRADVYALGCVLFECVTGSVPFVRDSDVATMLAHINDPPPSPSANRPDLGTGTDSVIARALAKSPEDRFSTCTELMSTFRQEAGMSHDDARPAADRTVVGGQPNGPGGGTVVAPSGGVAARPAHDGTVVAPSRQGAAQGGTVAAPNQQGFAAHSGTVVAPSQPGIPAPRSPMAQQQPPQQPGPSGPGWQQPQQPGPSGPGWQQPQQPGYGGPPPTQPGPGGPGYGGPPQGGPGYGGPPPGGGGGGSKTGLFVALGLVALLLIGGIVFVLTRGGDDNGDSESASSTAATETTSPSPSPSDTLTPSPAPSPTETDDGGNGGDAELGAFPNQFEETLLSHLPEGFIDSCVRLEFDLPASANAAITCLPKGADFIGYIQYNTRDTMNRDYNSAVEDEDVIKNSGSAGCQNGVPSEGVYTRANKQPGRLMCYLDGGDGSMDWTHESLGIYSFATRSDGNLKKLFEFWINAGPFGRPIPVD